ncbi:hypothetical protein [Pseudoalteromonas sp. SR41-1]|uniref:hypothetical protein n=1 Tax=Pseudoalteromonas sp. SR41-1 TaxID=2760952 RepID=UPI001603A958|nr:hypothetical protein [Pseudoalteromonas sp. SR41-1]MBB1281414.1 hypothetical protein [Pseudoalteromonas sp. SR41-1]
MKLFLLAGLIAGASALTALPSYAQTDTGVTAPAQNVSALVTILNNATAETSPEQLEADLTAAILAICSDCTPDQIDAMMNDVIAAIGADSPLISNFLAAMTAAGIDSDAVTLAAITAGVDATVASEATAAGPDGAPAPDAPVIVTLPTTAVPQGAGGTGGDAGISEVIN